MVSSFPQNPKLSPYHLVHLVKEAGEKLPTELRLKAVQCRGQSHGLWGQAGLYPQFLGDLMSMLSPL